MLTDTTNSNYRTAFFKVIFGLNIVKRRNLETNSYVFVSKVFFILLK